MEIFINFLEERYSEPQTALDYTTTFELICATVLSAQCTDERVNMVTPKLFEAYKDEHELAVAKRKDVEKIVYSTGFYRNKAKNLIGLAKAVVELGEVPDTLEELIKLPGVGRKTANVVLGNAFNTPGMVVDTHVSRIARRMKFTTEKDPVKIEFALMDLVPKDKWTNFSLIVIFLGREFCTARSPKCTQCPFNKEPWISL